MGRPHLRKLLLVTGTYKEKIGKNGVTSLSWSSWNICVSTERYRNGDFTVRNCLARKLFIIGFLLQLLILKKPDNLKPRLQAACTLPPALLTVPCHVGRAVYTCSVPGDCGGGGWQGSHVHSPQSLHGCSHSERGCGAGSPKLLGKNGGWGSCSAISCLTPSLMLTSSFCHLRLLTAYFTHIILQPCLEVEQGEDSWSVTQTCSTSINLLVKSQFYKCVVFLFYYPARST